jgi:hypothetical protein
VGRIALGVLALAGLSVAAGQAATAPKWTAKGAITKLNARTITVHGTSCRITTASPAHVTLHLYYVGAEAKIACADGVLRAIDVLHALPPVTSPGPAPCRATTLNFVANTSVSLSESRSCPSTSGGLGSLDVLAGHFPVTALSESSITAGAGSISVTCTVGNGSPDVGALTVGALLSRLTCRGGVLTAFTPA